MAKSLKAWLREYLAAVEGWDFLHGVQPVYDVSWSWLDRQNTAVVQSTVAIAAAATAYAQMIVPEGEVWLLERWSVEALAVGGCEVTAFCTMGGATFTISGTAVGTATRAVATSIQPLTRMTLHSGDILIWNCYNPTGAPINFRISALRHLVRP